MSPIRDASGRCVRCKANEKGLLIGIIGKNSISAYNGYANNAKESGKKIIEAPFQKGQRAFNSGDLMMYDAFGYMYFCDRLGDTYRWRGENVSTIEVENVISKQLDSTECVVYGVEVPGQEGRAGMAAIRSVEADVDLSRLSASLKTLLPAYAKPLFLRFMTELEHTGTFKAKKNKLVEDNYNVKALHDSVYYFDMKSQGYAKLTEEVYENILNGNIRL
jgi:solute carrier family 27 fatty acid transporter 1/4